MSRCGSRPLVVATSLILLTTVALAQSPVDPKSLIGDWVGDVEGRVHVK